MLRNICSSAQTDTSVKHGRVSPFSDAKSIVIYSWDGVLRVQLQQNGQFRIIKPTRCTNFSHVFMEWKSTYFGQFLCPPSGVFHCTHRNGICHESLLCVQWKAPDDGQRNCPKHVEFHSKIKFDKLVHLVGFIIRNLARCSVTWTSIMGIVEWRHYNSLTFML